MMAGGELALLVAFAVAMIATPGPANMLLFASGLNVGFRRTVPFLVGVLCGFQIVSLAAAIGLGGILLAVPEISMALRAASVAYIVWLALQIARSAPGARTAGRHWGLARGLAVHPLNPKAYAIAIGAYASFAGSGQGYPGRAGTVFVVLTLVGVVFNSLWVKAGDATEAMVGDGRVLRLVNRALAAVMVGVIAIASIVM